MRIKPDYFKFEVTIALSHRNGPLYYVAIIWRQKAECHPSMHNSNAPWFWRISFPSSCLFSLNRPKTKHITKSISPSCQIRSLNLITRWQFPTLCFFFFFLFSWIGINFQGEAIVYVIGCVDELGNVTGSTYKYQSRSNCQFLIVISTQAASMY